MRYTRPVLTDLGGCPAFEQLEKRLLLAALPTLLTSAGAEGFAYFRRDGVCNDALSFDASITGPTDIDSYVFAGAYGWTGTYTITVDAAPRSLVRPAVALYDGATGQRLRLVRAGGERSVSFSHLIYSQTEYVVAVTDESGVATGDVDVTINADGSTAATVVVLDGAGDGAISETIGLNNETDFFSFTAPNDTNGECDISLVPAAGFDAAWALFNSSGDLVQHASGASAGNGEMRTVTGLAPGATYSLSVMGEKHATSGGYDLDVDFELIVPDEFPNEYNFTKVPDPEGDYAGTFYLTSPTDWDGLKFASDALDPMGGNFRAGGSGAVKPILGLYDAATGDRIAWNSNLANASTASIKHPIDTGRAYYVVVSTKDGTTGAVDFEMDLKTPTLTGTLDVGYSGEDSVSSSLSNPADIDYFQVNAPPNTSGNLAITLTDAPAVWGFLTLWDATTGALLDEVEGSAVGQDVAVTFGGTVPGGSYHVAVASRRYETSGSYMLDVNFETCLPGTMVSAEGFVYFDSTGLSDDGQTFDSGTGHASIGGDGTDVDSFYFSGDDSWTGTYTVTVNRLDGGVDPVVAVYDATTGVLVAFDDDSGLGDGARAMPTLKGNVRYIVAVGDATRSNTGDVEIIVQSPLGSAASSVAVNDAGDGSRSGQYLGATDIDFFSFTAPAGTNGALTVEVASAPALDVAAVLYDEAGVERGLSATHGVGETETLSFSGLTPSATYTLTVLAHNYATTGLYSVDVDFDMLVPDAWPGVFTHFVVPDIHGDVAVNHTVTAPGKWEGWHVAAATGGAATFTAVGSGGITPILGMYDSISGQRLALDTNDDGDATAQIVTTLAQDTAYYVIVGSRDGKPGTVALSMDGPATSVPSVPVDLDGRGGVTGGWLGPAADIDYFRFMSPTTSNGDLTLDLTGVDAGLRAHLELWDETARKWRASATSPAPGSDAMLNYSNVMPGHEYVLAVAGYDYAAGGGFGLGIDFGVCLPGTMSTPEGFAVFGPSGNCDGTFLATTGDGNSVIDVGSDVDSFTFAGDAGWSGLYTITVAPQGGLVDPAVAVYDAATGTRIAFASDPGDPGAGATVLSVPLSPLTRHIVAVADVHSSGTGPVRITIDAPGATVPDVVLIGTGGDSLPAPGSLGGADTAFYSFTAPDDINAAGDLDLTVDPAAGLDAAIILTDAAGAELGRAYANGSGARESLSVSGIDAGDELLLTVLACDYATSGDFDVLIDFDLIVPDEFPGGVLPLPNHAPNEDGKLAMTFADASGWVGWTFLSDWETTGSFLVAGTARTPILGVYDAETLQRIPLAYDTNMAGLPSASTVAGAAGLLDRWHRYHVIARAKDGDDTLVLSMDLSGDQLYEAPITVYDSGWGITSDEINDRPDVDHFLLQAPAATTGLLTVTLHGAAGALTAALDLLHPDTGELLAHGRADEGGQDVIITYRGVEDLDTFDLAVHSRDFHLGQGPYQLTIDFEICMPHKFYSYASIVDDVIFHPDGYCYDTLTRDAYISPSDDVDVYWMHVPPGWDGQHTITVNALGGTVDPAVGVYSWLDGERFAFDDNSGPGTSARLTMFLHGGGAYMLAVADRSWTGSGDLEIIIEGPGSSEPFEIVIDPAGDGEALDNPSGMPSTARRFYSFTSPWDTNGRLDVEVDTVRNDEDVFAALLDAEGSELGRTGPFVFGKPFRLSADGLAPLTTYYLTVNYFGLGAHDVMVDFDLIVPDEYPVGQASHGRTEFVNVHGRWEGDVNATLPQGGLPWRAYHFYMDTIGPSTFTAETDAYTPLLGCYAWYPWDSPHEPGPIRRIGWDVNPGDLPTVTAAPVLDYTPNMYSVIVGDKYDSIRDGVAHLTIQVTPPESFSIPVDEYGYGRLEGHVIGDPASFDHPADLDYFTFTAPDLADGTLSVILSGLGPNASGGWLVLWDDTIDEEVARDYASAPPPGAVLTFDSVVPGHDYVIATLPIQFERSTTYSVSVHFGVATPSPGTPDLHPSGDTGVYDWDNVTCLDNSEETKTLQFRVPHTIAGATVTIYADGVVIGSGTATGIETTVTTSGEHDLVDDTHRITARQTMPGRSESDDSAGLTLIVDTAPPAVDLVYPGNLRVVYTTVLNAERHIDVAFTDVGGIGLDRPSILDPDREFTLGGAAAAGVTIGNSPFLVSGTTYRYAFSGEFSGGAVAVDFPAGAWRDWAGNPNAPGQQSFFVRTSLTWDGTDSAEWTEAHWDPGPRAPLAGEAMVVDSGTVDVSTDLTTTPGPAIRLDIGLDAPRGTVNIAPMGRLAVTGEVNVGVGGTVKIDGALTAGAVSITGGTLANSGNSVGTMTINSNVTLADAATLVVDALAAGTDKLVTDGAIALDANASLAIVLEGGNEFQSGTYTLIEAGSGLTGTFANVTNLGGYASVNGDGLTYDYVAGTVTLTLDMNLHPGDANLDGATDVSDRIIWNTNNFTFDTTFVTGDYNGDGATDVSDRIIWNTNNFTFATAAPPPPAAPPARAKVEQVDPLSRYDAAAVWPAPCVDAEGAAVESGRMAAAPLTATAALSSPAAPSLAAAAAPAPLSSWVTPHSPVTADGPDGPSGGAQLEWDLSAGLTDPLTRAMK